MVLVKWKEYKTTTPTALFLTGIVIFCIVLLPDDVPSATVIDRKQEDLPGPRFFIIGVKKGGTTSLSNYLSSLDSRFCILNEPNFFSSYDRYKRGYSWFYTNYMKDACEPLTNQKETPVIGRSQRDFIYGELASNYLFRPQPPFRIYKQLPNAKFIVLLRNPVDRLYSQWKNMKCGFEKDAALSFEDIVNQNHIFMQYSLYDTQIKAWLNTFDRSKFLFLRSEDFFSNPLQTLGEVLSFLGLPSSLLDGKTNKDFERVYGRVCTAGFPIEPLSVELRTRLETFYKPTVISTEKLLNKTFDWF